jgi:hypothetical protein
LKIFGTMPDTNDQFMRCAIWDATTSTPFVSVLQGCNSLGNLAGTVKQERKWGRGLGPVQEGSGDRAEVGPELVYTLAM